MDFEYWQGFQAGRWQQIIDVRNFIQTNYTPYEGKADFLAGITDKTQKVWSKCVALLALENEKGVLDVDTTKVSTITSHKAGYIDQENEVIFGLQTEKPLCRGVVVNGGERMAEQACEEYGYTLNPEIKDIYTHHATTHNSAVFSVYTPEMRKARKLGIITGLPDAYGRGRIIGDYRRIALYGIDALLERKKRDLDVLFDKPMDEETLRSRDEIAKQIKALKDMISMAKEYGCDIARPARTAKEAVQAVYFGYLAAIKEQNGAAMSIGRVSTFLDIYIERDLKNGVLTEEGAQELMDQFVIKLRLARMLRTPEYNYLPAIRYG